MDDLGPPIAYTVLREGTPVYDSGGERVGLVEEVVADMTTDIFDGVIIHTVPMPGHHLFAGADQIAELHERGVVLSVDRDALRDQQERPGGKRSTDDRERSPLEARLARAWDRIAKRH